MTLAARSSQVEDDEAEWLSLVTRGQQLSGADLFETDALEQHDLFLDQPPCMLQVRPSA